MIFCQPYNIIIIMMNDVKVLCLNWICELGAGTLEVQFLKNPFIITLDIQPYKEYFHHQGRASIHVGKKGVNVSIQIFGKIFISTFDAKIALCWGTTSIKH